MLKHVFVATFPRASSRLWRWTSSRVAKASTAAASCCSSGVAKRSSISRAHCCHRMTVRAAGGRRTACATPNRCEQQQQQQQQQQQHRSSQANIGAVVGRTRVFCGVMRDAVGFKKFFDRVIRSAHPVEKVDFLCGSDCSIERRD